MNGGSHTIYRGSGSRFLGHCPASSVLHEEHIYPIERNSSDGTQCAFCAPLTAALNSIVPAPRGSRHGEIQGIPGGILEASVNVGAGNAQHPGLLLQTRGNADQ